MSASHRPRAGTSDNDHLTHDHSPIDIVYLWVDGLDPTWRRKRKACSDALSQASRDTIGRHGNVEGRFRDNDERALPTQPDPHSGHLINQVNRA